MRLDDRFALLRGRDRSAPARHQTLTAVIGWSWDLLAADEQRALAWLSVFHDGFAADGARATCSAATARDLVEALVDQSLLDGRPSTDGAARYRMLETVREFGAPAARRGRRDGDAARDGLRPRWAVGLPTGCGASSSGRDQVEAVDLLDPEEGNLADVLRRRSWPATRRRGAGCSPRWARCGRSPGTIPRFFAHGRPRRAAARGLGAAARSWSR